MDTLDLCAKAVTHSENLGAEGEAYGVSVRKIVITLERNAVKTCNTYTKEGIGIRVFKNKCLGFASTNQLTVHSVRAAAEKSVNLSLYTSPSPYNVFPEKMNLPKVKGLYDEKSKDFTPKDALLYAERMLSVIRGTPEVMVKSGEVTCLTGTTVVVNSRGICTSERKSLFFWYLFGMSQQGPYNYVFDAATSLDGITVEKTAETFIKKAGSPMKSRKIHSFCGDVIFTPYAVFSILVPHLGYAVNAGNVVRGMSPFSGKMGVQVGSPLLTVEDNATLPGGVLSGSFDREGVPRRQLDVVQKGVLKTFLYDTQTALQDSTKSTGNASGGFRDIPRISCSNVVFHQGRTSFKEMIEETGQGVLVQRVSGFPQFTSGLINGEIKEGYFIEKGEIKHAVSAGTLLGNFSTYLHSVQDVSKEVERISHVYAPYIKIGNARVTGGR